MIHQFKQLMRDLDAGKAGNTLMVLACVLFLSAQTVDLTHYHGSDANQQVDCEICVKLGSDDEIIIDSTAAQVPESHFAESADVQPTWFAQAPLPAHARAPPQA
tara:strand:- start:10145 stop:10456 length:312 start_codon:yes stop_codon:yes gene_type:complete